MHTPDHHPNPGDVDNPESLTNAKTTREFTWLPTRTPGAVVGTADIAGDAKQAMHAGGI